MIYGESLFTTFLFSGETPFYLTEHLERTYKGLEFLFGSGYITSQLYKNVWQSLNSAFKECNHDIDYSIRLTFFLKSFSRSFLPSEKEDLCFFIWVSPVKLSREKLKSVSVRLAQTRRTPNEKPSFLKMGNYGETLIELRKAKQKGFEDVLFLDNKNSVKECSTSNIFFVKGNKLVTPQLDSCLLEGITRRNFMKFWKFWGGIVTERKLALEEVKHFDAILLTNSIQLIRPCFQIGDIKLKEKKILDLNHLELFQNFYSYSKENSDKELINYEKEKSRGCLSSLQEKI